MARQANPIQVTQKLRARFWSRVEAGGEDCCWEWLGSKDRQGYGRFKSGQSSLKAHRVSLMLAGRKVLPSQVVCHRCDNPSCVNPSHLFAGSRRDNVHDCIRKGRWRIPERGEAHPNAKLTAEAVLAIRASALTDTELAKLYGVTSGTVHRVRQGKTWAHIPVRTPHSTEER